MVQSLLYIIGNEKIFIFLSIFTVFILHVITSTIPWVVGHNLIGIVTSREEIPDLPKVGRNTEQFCYGSMDGV